jgi:hypothetical protein
VPALFASSLKTTASSVAIATRNARTAKIENARWLAWIAAP